MSNAVTTQQTSPTALSNDIHVITAEINVYQRTAGEAIFEIGRRLHEVKYNPIKFGLPSGTDKEGRTIVARGAWGEFLTSVNTTLDASKWFIAVYVELGDDTNRCTYTNKGLRALYEIATMPEEQRELEHAIPSTGEVKKVDEMTVRELREVKAELKRKDAEIAEAKRSEQEVKAKLSAVESELAKKPKEVVVEREVEKVVTVDKTDYSAVERLKAELKLATEKAEQAETARQLAEQKAQQYEQVFGEQTMYDASTTRVTNGDAITYAVYSFQEDVLEFTQKYAHLPYFAREFDEMIDEGREEYLKAIDSAKRFLDSLERRLTQRDATIIEQ